MSDYFSTPTYAVAPQVRSISKAAWGKVQAVGAGIVLSSAFGLFCQKVLLLKKTWHWAAPWVTFQYMKHPQAAAPPCSPHTGQRIKSRLNPTSLRAKRHVTGGGYRHWGNVRRHLALGLWLLNPSFSKQFAEFSVHKMVWAAQTATETSTVRSTYHKVHVTWGSSVTKQMKIPSGSAVR